MENALQFLSCKTSFDTPDDGGGRAAEKLDHTEPLMNMALKYNGNANDDLNKTIPETW
jgi:hypothetical protein